MERGEKLNDLVDRSNALSAQSKMFYKTAKKVSLYHPNWATAGLIACRFTAKFVLRCDVDRNLKHHRLYQLVLLGVEADCFVVTPISAISHLFLTLF